MRLTAQRIDEIVCDWTVRHGIGIQEHELNDLVDALEKAEKAPEPEDKVESPWPH